MGKIRRKDLKNTPQFRIIPSRFPPIPMFEALVDPEELEIAFALESATNDRVRAEAGNLFLVDKSQWVTGPGASIVMAAFTHFGRESRFSRGDYGVYYASLDEETAIAETVFHQERRLKETQEDAIELEMRCYSGTALLPMHDIRGSAHQALSNPDIATWPACQRLGAELRDSGSNGLLYRSARRTPGKCIAAFEPTAVSLPIQSQHLKYCWNGDRIDRVFSVSDIRVL
ncbi:MAG: RES family NAD+ phosphorylase [Pseudomonadota bacterium]